MAAYIRQRPASWFWLVGIAITFWGSAGCAAWLAARTGIAFAPAAAPPGWGFAIAAGALLGGGVALLNKKLVAGPLFGLALLGAAAEIIRLVSAGDLLPGRALLAGAIVATAALLLWFAVYARRRGWIT